MERIVDHSGDFAGYTHGAGNQCMSRFALQLIAGLLCPFFLPLLVHYKSDNETDISSTVGADRGGEVSADESSKSHKKQTFASRIWSKAGGRVDPELGDGIIVDADEKPNCSNFQISYLAFLCLYSYTLLFKFGPSLPNWSASHLLLYVWVLSLVLEELRQALLSKISFSAYISDTWNIFDIVAILLFNIGAISFILRLATPVVEALFGVQGDQAGISSSQETLLRLSRLCLALALFVFFLRILQFFSISVTLGPKVVMIQNMRYLLMREFSERSPIAPPLVALWHLAWPLRFLAKRCCVVGDVGGDAHSGDTPFKTSYADDRQKERQLMQWERIRALEFLRKPGGVAFRTVGGCSLGRGQADGAAGGRGEQGARGGTQPAGGVLQGVPARVDGRVRRLDSMEAQLGQLKDLLEGLKDRLSERHIEVVTSIKNCSIRAAAPESPSATHEVQPSDSVSPSAKSKRKAGDWHWPQSGHFDEELDDPAASDVQPSAWLVALHQHKLCRLLPIGCLKICSLESVRLGRTRKSTDAIEDSFNGFDQAGGFSRKSHGGRYAVANSAPRNPYKSCTSTTAPDRGGLPLWGPNHCAVLAVTRWKRDDRQNAVKRGGRPVLQAAHHCSGKSPRVSQF
uniref:Ion_trans domain-containing protein n=1 Tax=Macrostomum lignano TaxID=282301 RepID=A0A1I8FA93_9PLAT